MSHTSYVFWKRCFGNFQFLDEIRMFNSRFQEAIELQQMNQIRFSMWEDLSELLLAI